jgi:hypothetical protein
MQDVLFAAVLFVCYFVFACYFFSPNKPQQVEPTASILSEKAMAAPTSEMSVRQASLSEAWSSEPPSTIAEALSGEFEPEPEQESSTLEPPNQEPTLEELFLGIDLDTLQLRPARKICGRLGIQQKVNSKDAPLSWLRAQIKAKLSEKPTEVVPVIQEVLLAS